MEAVSTSQLLALAAEAARLFPDPTREIGPAGLHWFAGVLRDAGAGVSERLDCYLALRQVIWNGPRGDLAGWFERSTVGEVIKTLEAAACEVI